VANPWWEMSSEDRGERKCKQVLAQEQSPKIAYPPLSHSRQQYYLQHPQEFEELLLRMPQVSSQIPAGKKSGSWGVSDSRYLDISHAQHRSEFEQSDTSD
jgi:hypothetical protein